MIYDSAFFRRLFFFLSWAFLKVGRWRTVGEVPTEAKYVAIAAPHTSNWDFPLFMALVGYKGMRVRFLGKHTLFQGTFGKLFYWLGGIPVHRESAAVKGVFNEAVQIFSQSDELVLGIAPEGTRSSVKKWKSGFYRIAVEADVPIALAYLDANKREIGFGPVFHPTGNQETDIHAMQAFYAEKRGIKR